MLFAEINSETNVVIRVIVCNSKEWCEHNLGGTWVQTYDDAPDKNYARTGYVYHPEKGNFSCPQPYSSWTMDDSCKWVPPVPHPDDGGFYSWNEETLTWDAQQMQDAE